MPAIPASHIADSHKLVADGKIDLWSLTPPAGSPVHFKADEDATWQSIFFKGVPLIVTGEKVTSEGGWQQPKLQIGQPNVDLSLFKGLIFDGYVDNAIVIRQKILREDLENDVDIKEVLTYRVKRVEAYGKTMISLQLATVSDSLGFMIPHRLYVPPAFPSVRI